MLIACDFRWEMGHRIKEHAGLCRNLHGHSYRMRVSIEGEVQPNGMVIDFYDLKTIVDPIVESLDHCFLCDEHDTVMREFFITHPMKVALVPFASTVENIAQHILELVKIRVSNHTHLHAVTVRVEETSTSFAEARALLHRDAS